MGNWAVEKRTRQGNACKGGAETKPCGVKDKHPTILFGAAKNQPRGPTQSLLILTSGLSSLYRHLSGQTTNLD